MSEDCLCHVALLEWSRGDGIAEAIQFELERLGYHCTPFQVGSPFPEDVNVVFSFAPYGDFMVVPSQLAKMPVEQRPILVHWKKLEAVWIASARCTRIRYSSPRSAWNNPIYISDQCWDRYHQHPASSRMWKPVGITSTDGPI